MRKKKDINKVKGHLKYLQATNDRKGKYIFLFYFIIILLRLFNPCVSPKLLSLSKCITSIFADTT